MGNTNVVTPLVYPSQNDLHGTGPTGDGNTALEKYNREIFKAVQTESYFLSGTALPTTAADRNLIVPAGSAYISGYYVTWAQTTVALPASVTSHIFVALMFSGGLVSAVQIVDNTTGTAPSDSIKFGTVVTSASAITSSTDQRLFGGTRIRRAVITAIGLTNWVVPANITLVRMRVFGAGGGGGGGGPGDGISQAGGNGAPGRPGAYVEVVQAVTPGSIVAVTLAAGGSGGSGGSGGGNGSTGAAAGQTTLTGTGFSFTADGGTGGEGGFSVANGGASRPHLYLPATASQSSGVADLLWHGGGLAGGALGAGQINAGVAGGAGQSARCIIEY